MDQEMKRKIAELRRRGRDDLAALAEIAFRDYSLQPGPPSERASRPAPVVFREPRIPLEDVQWGLIHRREYRFKCDPYQPQTERQLDAALIGQIRSPDKTTTAELEKEIATATTSVAYLEDPERGDKARALFCGLAAFYQKWEPHRHAVSELVSHAERVQREFDAHGSNYVLNHRGIPIPPQGKGMFHSVVADLCARNTLLEYVVTVEAKAPSLRSKAAQVMSEQGVKP